MADLAPVVHRNCGGRLIYVPGKLVGEEFRSGFFRCSGCRKIPEPADREPAGAVCLVTPSEA